MVYRYFEGNSAREFPFIKMYCDAEDCGMKKFNKKLDQITRFIAGISFSAMIIITSVNVFSRFIFSKSFAWSEELTYLFFNWTVFFGICGVYKRQGLISIDSLVKKLSQRGQRIAAILSFGFVAALNVALTIWGWQLTIGGWARKTANLKIPYTFVDICLPIAMMIMCYYSVAYMIKEIKGQTVEQASLENRS